MGVKGLWKVIESAGVPVPLETLEHKVLGVDVSIWLHQAVRGFRGPGGAAVANAHLLTLFHRICKLLFYRIRPVFVFDGGVPHLKKQTLASRKLRKEVATNKARQVRERLFKNLLKSQAVRTALGKSGPGPSSVHVPQVTKREKDLFELPPLTDALAEGTTEGLEEERNSSTVQCFNLPNLHHFDLESEEFKNMPLEAKHEILNELQDTRKQNSWATINDMPQQSENFAEFQMARLMKRAKFQATLDSTREEIRKAKVSEMEEELFGDIEKYVSLSTRIISEDASHAVFVKKVKKDGKSNPDTVGSDRKGKAPLRKKKPIDKDFLTELAKVGIIRPNNEDTDSDSDGERDNFHLLHGDGKGWNDSSQEYKNDDESFLQVVSSLMENSGLTQDEILALIKQDSRENAIVECKNEIYDGPSTSANAPGTMFNPDDSSSDEDNFIEVSPDVQLPQLEEDKEISANNIDKLLGTKTNSLWMKIVQQKVDDMVHVKTLQTSPKKAIIDSRNVEKESITKKEQNTSKDKSGTPKPVLISLNFEVKPLKMQDNIFSDIFPDLVCQPKSLKTSEFIPEECERSRQCIQGQYMKCELDTDSKVRIDNADIDKSRENKLGVESSFNKTPNSQISDANSHDAQHRDFTHTKSETPLQNEDVLRRNKTENRFSSAYWRGNSEGKVTHDEVEIMSSSDETEDEDDIVISAPQPSSLIKTTRSILSKNTDENKAEAIPIKIEHNENECIDNNDSKAPEIMHVEDQKDSNLQHVALKGQNVLDQVAEATPLGPIKTSYTEHENNMNNSRPLDITSGNGTILEAKGGTRETVDTEKKDEKEENMISCSDHSENIPETTSKYKNIREVIRPATKMEAEDIIMLNGDKEVTVNENTEQDDSTNTIEGFLEVDDELDPDENVEEEEEAGGTADINGVQETEVERPLAYTVDELKQLEGELASEQQALVAQAQRCERHASSLNDQMYGESQHLLQLFGIPYLVAPMEAEAQCAFLNTASLTEGTITDDSDIFLFGGNSVYRNFFNQSRHVELFKTENIKATVGLGRSKMITLAFLCGSDYTEGLEGIGSVSAMEALAEFPGEGIECLQNLTKWWRAAHKVSTIQHSKIKQKLAQISLPDSFPNESVFEAYLAPEVDESREKFTWAVPNVEALRVFTAEKFGWNCTKTDEILLPVMKKLKIRTFQKRIESYFTNIRLVKEPKVASKRMQDAIAKAKGITSSNSGQAFKQAKVKQREKKRKLKKDPIRMQVNEENKQSCSEVVADTKYPEPRRTLLVDPSEINSKSVTEGRKGQKRKKDQKEDNNCLSHKKTEKNEFSPRKVTKEDMFKSLLEKETISQREKSKLDMQEKKMSAVTILHKKNKEKKVRKR